MRTVAGLGWGWRAGLVAAAIAAAPGALGQAPGARTHLVVTSGFQADVIPLRCLSGDDETATPGGLVTLSRTLSAAGEGLRVDAGDLLGSSALGHLASSEHLPLVAEAVAALGYRALAVGHRDLGAPRADLVARARALSARGVPMVLSNLRCADSAREVCEALRDASDPPLLIDTPSGRVAFVALISPGSLSAIAHDRSEGLTLAPPTEALALATVQARAAGAATVVAVHDPEWPGTLVDTLQMVHALPAGQRPDVVLGNDLSGQVSDLHVARDGVRVYATEPGRALRVDLADRTAIPEELRPDPGSTAPVHPAIAGLRRAVIDDFCALSREALPGAALVRPLDRQGFTDLLLDVMRESSGAEVGVINAGAVRPAAGFPLEGRVTRLAVMGALPFDDELRAGPISGEDLVTFMESTRAARFRVRGITREGDVWMVNGRRLDPAQDYRVVTTGFVADGGDGGLGEDLGDALSTEGTLGPREVLLRWLARPRSGDITRAPIDPARRTRWTFRAFIDASWAETAINNPRNYQDTQLARSGSTAIQVDGEFRADAEHPRYTLDNLLRLRIGFTRTVDEAGDDTGLQKSADLISLRNQVAWRGVWRRRWYLPQPYAESYLESEFQPPSGSMANRDFHHLQWRPTAGLRLELPFRSTLNLGAGVDREMLDPNAVTAPVVVARAELPPQRLFRIDDRPVEGQLFTELAWRDPGSSGSDAQVRLTARLSVPLFDPLSVTVSYDLFARRRGDDPWGLAHDLNFGLQFDLTRTLQAFSY